MSNVNKVEDSKRGIDLLDMTVKITIVGLDENIEKLEHLKKLLQEIEELSQNSATK